MCVCVRVRLHVQLYACLFNVAVRVYVRVNEIVFSFFFANEHFVCFNKSPLKRVKGVRHFSHEKDAKVIASYCTY